MTEMPSAIVDTLEYSNPDAKRRLASLVGIDDQRARLEKGLRLILHPEALDKWAKQHHGGSFSIIEDMRRRPPLFVLAGDVGVGKTALAESIGDAVARAESIPVRAYRMSLASRGSGLVGEMTGLISAAFKEVASHARKAKSGKGARPGHILLIDEADALAQSRETTQMHHEDRAGVNALIRGVDDLSGDGLPAAVIMCTNRLSALDPAIKRRAADIITFERPTDEHRRSILGRALIQLGFSDEQIEVLVKITGANGARPGFTYSDLTQRYLPKVLIDAYPDQPIRFERAQAIAQSMAPTPQFRDEASHA